MTESIVVEHVTQNQATVRAMEQLAAGFSRLERQVTRTSQASKKGADAARGSFAALEKELRDNERALAKLVVGSKEYVAQKAKVDELRAAHKKVKLEVKGTNEQLNKGPSMLEGIAGGVKSVAGQFGAAALAAQALTKEIEHQKRLKENAAAATRTLDESLEKASINLSPEEIEQFKPTVREGALAAGVPQQEYATVVANNMGAGAKNLAEADAAARLAYSAVGSQTEDARELSAVALDFRDKTGGSLENAMGLVPQVAKLSRATDQAQNFANITPAALAGTADRSAIDGLGLERSLEMVTTFAMMQKDRTGADAAQTHRDFLSKLNAFAPELKDGVSREDAHEFTSNRSAEERLEALRSNPALRAQFSGTLGESKSSTFIRQFVSDDADVLAMEQRAIKGIDTKKAAGQLANRVRVLDDATKIGQIERRNDASLEYGQTESPVRAILGAAQQTFDETLDDVNQPGWDWLENQAAPETGIRGLISPLVNSPLTQLEQKKARVQYMQTDTIFGLGGVNDADRGKLERLEDTLQVAIDELKRVQQESNDLQKEQLQAQKELLQRQPDGIPFAPPPVEQPVAAAAIGGQ